jgi:hypothetical protein
LDSERGLKGRSSSEKIKLISRQARAEGSSHCKSFNAIERFERGAVNLALTEVWLFGLHAIPAPKLPRFRQRDSNAMGQYRQSYVRFK